VNAAVRREGTAIKKSRLVGTASRLKVNREKEIIHREYSSYMPT
jgi:hypothetical protein